MRVCLRKNYSQILKDSVSKNGARVMELDLISGMWHGVGHLELANKQDNVFL